MKSIEVWLQHFKSTWEKRFSQLDKVIIKLNTYKK